MNVFDLMAKISLDTSEYDSKLGTAGGKLMAFGGGLTSLGKSMTKSVTTPIVALGALSVKAFNDVKDALNIVTQKTGASGQALAEMHESVKTIASEVPASFEDIGTAVGEVNTRFGVTGSELEALSSQFVKFAKVNGTDVNTSIDTVQKALANFGLEAKDANSLLDTMTRVGQNTGVSMETLMNGLVQNGAAFQQLGLSIEQSVALMGELDKSGANSEAVMMGLRRALKNAAKEGVPLDQALSDLQDTIANGKDGMDGLTAAYELFGRSGDQIYGAVKNGTINFKELGKATVDAGGALDKTFEKTLTPAERFQKTLNSLKVTGYEFGNTTLSMLAPMLGKAQKKIQELSESWKSMDKGTKESIVKFLGLAAAIGPVLTIGGKLITTIGTLANGFGKLFSLLAANPFVAAAVAITGLSVAVYEAYKSNQRYIESTYGLSESQQQAVDSLNEVTNAYKETASAAQESNAAVDSQFDHIRALKDEYNNLVQANGEVAEGDKARAGVILGELANALGVEKSQIEEMIGANGKLTGSIDKVIAKKEAQAYLDANYDNYVKAIEMQSKSEEQLANALQVVNERERTAAALKADLAAKQQAYNAAASMGGDKTGALKHSMEQAEEKYKTAVSALDEAKASVNDYAQASADASGRIANYSQLQEAVQTGSINKINAAMQTYQMNLKTVTTASAEELQKQAADATNNYNTIKAAYDSGQAGITKTMVDNAKARMDAANAEKNKVSASAQAESGTITDAMSTAQKGATGDFKKISGAASTEMGKASKAVSDTAKDIKDTFPINLGQLFKGTVAKIATTVKEKANGGKTVTPDIKYIKFAKAMEQPYMFTRPTLFDANKIAGEAGDEILYGRDSLLRDIRNATSMDQKVYAAILSRMDAIIDAIDEGKIITVDHREFARLVSEVE